MSTPDFNKKATASKAAPGVPFYTPAQPHPVGTALALTNPAADPAAAAAVPTVFTPLTIRGMTLQNRFAVSPMCMYSADDGHLTDFHLVHLGGFAYRGAALTIVEATAVQPNGGISPEDSGLWQDSQIAPLKRVVDFVHSQGQKIGVQLGHAGRKASVLSPFHVHHRAEKAAAGPEVGGWPGDVVAPSAISYSEGSFVHPRAMTIAEIEALVRDFASAARRAVAAGVDTIEIHGAHGYLLTQFLSPLTNKRTDRYGGSFENRTRLLLDVVAAVRAVIPATMPLMVRVSATEWMEWAGEPSWDLAQSVRLAKVLPDLGVDLLDVSSGGNNAGQRIRVSQYFQADLARHIRAALRAEGKTMLIGAVGMIASAEVARELVQEDETAGKTVVVEGEHGMRTHADLVLAARQFLREPEFVLRSAWELGVDVQWPLQYERAPFPKKL